MIELSRSAPPQQGLLLLNRRSKLVTGCWLAICSWVDNGCIYVEPVEIPMNRAPEILVPADSSSLQAFELSADQQPLVVSAFDEDNDDLVFLWDWSPRDVPNQQQPTFQDENGGVIWTSVLLVARDARLDGRQINCSVTDFDSTTTVEWTVELEP